MNVTLLGLGLIGGSLARAWRAGPLPLTLTGHDRPEVLAQALEAGVIDRAADTPESAVSGADIVVMALPLPALLDAIPRIAPHLSPHALVTDVGSVKAVVQDAAQVLRPGAFVGGHPMAGAEKGGFAHSDAFLFENAVYVLCPPPGMPTAVFTHQYATLVALVEATGARVMVLDAHRHDEIAARVSHVPQLLATALAAATGAQANDDDALLTLAAGGFRDMTRIAASPFGVWQGILDGNRAQVVSALDQVLGNLHALRDALEARDDKTVGAFFEQGALTRTRIPQRSKGFLHPLHEVNLYAVDAPGFLYRITGLLYDAGLNVKDLELLKIREGTGGMFRLGFAGAADARNAVAVLQAAGYRTTPV